MQNYYYYTRYVEITDSYTIIPFSNLPIECIPMQNASDSL